MQAKVQIKNVYGNKTVYPADETTRKLAQLAGTKTLTPYTIKIAKDLGFVFVVVQETL